jgi:four helix bundle protein
MSGENQVLPNLRDRTTAFALDIVRLYVSLPKQTAAQVLGRQLLRSGTSVGAHYREALRGRSSAEFISKLGGALQELEEAAYWLELLEKSNATDCSALSDLQREAQELTAILVSCRRTAKARRKTGVHES